MSTPVALRGSSKHLEVRPAAPATVVPRVIDLDVRPAGADVGTDALARRAAARYVTHGTALLAQVPTSTLGARAASGPAGDGWMLVGRWLTWVAVIAVCFLAWAWSGQLTTR